MTATPRPVSRAGTIAERYLNTINTRGPMECVRFWAADWLLVGGSIIDDADWRHLAKDFGIREVFSFETEHDHDERIMRTDRDTYWTLHHIPFPDDGKSVPLDVLETVWGAVNRLGQVGLNVYVHCQQGRFRSPAMAWMIIKLLEGRDASLDIARAIPHFDPSNVYMRSVREFIESRVRP